MKKYFNFFLYLFLILLLLLPQSSTKATSFNDLELHSNCILLMEKETGEVLFERNGYTKMYPASTTKILTAILVLEKCYLNEIVEVSQSALSAVPPTYTTAGLKVRRKISYRGTVIYNVNTFRK